MKSSSLVPIIGKGLQCCLKFQHFSLYANNKFLYKDRTNDYLYSTGKYKFAFLYHLSHSDNLKALIFVRCVSSIKYFTCSTSSWQPDGQLVSFLFWSTTGITGIKIKIMAFRTLLSPELNGHGLMCLRAKFKNSFSLLAHVKHCSSVKKKLHHKLTKSRN